MQRPSWPALFSFPVQPVRDLERIACPSLVIACRQDRLRSFGETERMAKHLPHARFEVIEDCGHMAPLEKPHELAALLADWVVDAGL